MSDPGEETNKPNFFFSLSSPKSLIVAAISFSASKLVLFTLFALRPEAVAGSVRSLLSLTIAGSGGRKEDIILGSVVVTLCMDILLSFFLLMGSSCRRRLSLLAWLCFALPHLVFRALLLLLLGVVALASAVVAGLSAIELHGVAKSEAFVAARWDALNFMLLLGGVVTFMWITVVDETLHLYYYSPPPMLLKQRCLSDPEAGGDLPQKTSNKIDDEDPLTEEYEDISLMGEGEKVELLVLDDLEMKESPTRVTEIRKEEVNAMTSFGTA